VIIQETGQTLPPPSEHERETLGQDLLRRGYRLACETVPAHDATVLVPEESRVRPQIILTSGTDYLYPARLQPEIENCPVQVPPATLQHLKADRERLLTALFETYGLKRLSVDPVILRKLPKILRSGHRGFTCTLWRRKEIIALQEGIHEDLFGMAFDMGTTTVVAYLMDLRSGQELSVRSAMNPQIPFGDDVISRISYAQNHPGGLERLRAPMLQCLNTLIAEAAAEVRIDPSRIMETALVGNTAMHHFLMGLETRYLALAPYAPALTDAQTLKARDLGLDMGPGAYAHMLPLKAGFVGSDAIACILATGIHRKKRPTLLIDLGTNGEIVLGNRDRLVCCSTAAGPAFEGGHIKWGMRAAPGAIERVRIRKETLEVSVETIHDEPPVGICGSGLISAVAEMIRAGVLLSRGNFSGDMESPRILQGEDGPAFVLVWAADSGVEQDIVITQRDVAALQMAKSAVHAGARLLWEALDNERVSRILLAGAGGNYVDPRDARTIDLFPPCGEKDIRGIGNAAGYGACLALLDGRKRREAERIAERTEYRELSGSRRFQDLFVEGMFFAQARDYQEDF
jgi:uncharacterized 2Fe-2S/4Fe-4S cluster protein (DUF4445 family)